MDMVCDESQDDIDIYLAQVALDLQRPQDISDNIRMKQFFHNYTIKKD